MSRSRNTRTIRRGPRAVLALVALAASTLFVGGFLASAGAEEVTEPPAVEQATPPAEETPPVVEETPPPVVEETPPPVVVETPPPTTPPVVVTKPPVAAKTVTAPKTALSAGPSAKNTGIEAKPVDVPPVPENLVIPLHNATADPGTDCPDDGLAYWHFVTTPNNGSSQFVAFHLNLGDGTHTLGFVPNGSQLDNVFVAVPSGYTLTSLVLASSTADIIWDGTGNAPTRFNLSHTCAAAEPTGSLEVTKVVENQPVVDTEFTIHVECDDGSVNEDVVFTSHADGSVTPANHSFDDIELGSVCTVEEQNPPVGVTPVYDPAGADDPGVTVDETTPDVSVEITNSFPTPETGSLAVSKSVVNPPEVDTDFTIHVECDDESVNEDVTFTSHADGSVTPASETFTGIELGSVCTVEEENPPTGVTPVYNPAGADDPGVTVDETTPTVAVEVTNSFPGSLEVTKVVENAPEVDTDFTIHVECDDGSVNEDVVFTSHANGTVTPANESFTGIELGSVCTVEEENPPASVTPIYDPAGAPDPGVTISANTPDVSVQVTNSFPGPGGVGSLEVTKVVENPPAVDTDFTIHVACDDSSVDEDVVFTSHSDGSVTPASESFEGIDFGTTCTVVEENPPASVTPIYTPASAPDPGLTIDESTPIVSVQVTNSFPGPAVAGGVSVTKAIGPGGTPKDGTVFTVAIECTDGTNATLEFTYPNDLGPKSVPVNIPEGGSVTCTVEETNVGANVTATYDPANASQSGFVLDVNVPTQPVVVTNSFTEVDPGVVTREPGSSTGLLPFTGSVTDTLLKLAGLLLLAGGGAALLTYRRRQRQITA